MTRATAFVAGATGLTGRYVIEHLTRRGDEAIAHVRADSPRLADWRARFTALGARVDETPWEPEAIARTIEASRPRWIFGCLGTTRARVKQAAKEGRDPSKETYDAVDVAMTEMLIDAAKRAGSGERFVYLSSIGAGGTGNAYLAARTRVETTLRASGVPFTIARPSTIVGDRDVPRGSEKIAGTILDAGLGLIGALGARTTRDRYRSITGRDLAGALVALAADPGWEGRIAQGEDLQRLVPVTKR